MFKDDEEMIIDELITFFFAGSQTTAASLSNLIMNAMKQPTIIDKIRSEINDVIVDNYDGDV